LFSSDRYYTAVCVTLIWFWSSVDGLMQPSFPCVWFCSSMPAHIQPQFLGGREFVSFMEGRGSYRTNWEGAAVYVTIHSVKRYHSC